MLKMFSTNMSYADALYTLFKETEGKAPEEIKKIKEEYLKVLPGINRREHDDGPYLTSYVISQH